MTTKPEVFIIESLDFEDEQEKRAEGLILSSILALSGKKCEYYYIRTMREVPAVLEMFTKSRYRYLHLSCHGESGGKALRTTLDRMGLVKLDSILKPHLRNRRLFLSACSIANEHFAKTLMTNSGCRSILGPKDEIDFHIAPILWASLYSVMFEADETGMKHGVLAKKAQEVATMFQVSLNFIKAEKKDPSQFSMNTIDPVTEPAPEKTIRVRRRS